MSFSLTERTSIFCLNKLTFDIPIMSKRQTEKTSEFGLRLLEAFDSVHNYEIAKLLGVSKPAVTAYMQGRIPPHKILLQVHELTGFSLHWLLTGEGEKKHQKNNLKTNKFPFIIALQCDRGKSKTSQPSTLIAATLAAQGFKTLLIESDGDIAPGHNLFSGLFLKYRNDKNTPDLDSAEDSKTVFDTEVMNLSFLTSNQYLKHILYREGVEHHSVNRASLKQEFDFLLLDISSGINLSFQEDGFIGDLLKDAYFMIVSKANSYDIDRPKFVFDEMLDLQKQGGDPRFLGLFFSGVKIEEKETANSVDVTDTAENFDALVKQMLSLLPMS